MSEKQQKKSLHGKAAHKALQKHFVKLISAVTISNIAVQLYSEEIIDEQTLDHAISQSHTDSEKGMKICRHLQKIIKLDPKKFDSLCQILKEEDVTKELARKLQDEFALQLSQIEDTTVDIEFENLKTKLEVYVADRLQPDKQKNADELIKSAIRQYVGTLLQSGMTYDTLKSHIQSLCQDEAGLFPADLHKWIFDEIESIELSSKLQRTLALNTQTPSSPTQRHKSIKLFDKNSIYHASICCQAVSTCTSINLEKFFQTNGYTFSGISLSAKTHHDQYLVATQEDILYVAFQSEINIDLWLQKYKSFPIGLEQQTSRIPLRFFIEQLQLGKRIVITGFSFGGMLACSVIARLWKETYINASLLEENVICITFGQPLIQIPSVQEAIKALPKLEKTIHQIFSKDDIIPGLLHYFRLGCLHYTTMKSLGSQPSSNKQSKTNGSNESLGAQEDFSCQFGQLFLPNMATLQEVANKKPSYSGALSSRVSPQSELQAAKDLKATLKQLMECNSVEFKPSTSSLYGICYMISTEERHGLVWTPEATKSMVTAILYMDKAAIEKFDSGIFKKHNMEHYKNITFRSYLEKTPRFTIPNVSTSAIKPIQFLKPEIKRVECHMYPKETVLVLKGDNLWFCYEVILGLGEDKKTISTPAHSITRKSIQVNYKALIQQTTEYATTSSKKMNVTLHSHFFGPLNSELIFHQNRYSFSVRQIQLAKHTPTEVIELAYWTAMLERNSHKAHQQPSKRFTAIIRFLEEAVTVVPLESIIHAIAYGSNRTALECARALKESKLKIPNSVVTFTALVDACIHLSSGVQLTNLNKDEIDIFRINFMLNREMRKILFSSQFQPSIMETPDSSVPSYSDVVRGSPDEEDLLTLRQTLGPAFFLCHLFFPIFDLALGSIVERENPLDEELSDFIEEMLTKMLQQVRCTPNLPAISGKYIKQLYPVSPLRHTMQIPILQSPVTVLNEARKHLKNLDDIQDQLEDSAQNQAALNEQMLTVVKDIHETNLQVCTTLLAAFMEQQIRIPLLSSPADMASNILSASSAPVAMGVWALFSKSLKDLQHMLSSARSNTLYVEIEAYIAGVLENQNEEENTEKKPEEKKYAGKLQFLLEGLTRTATCSTEYISYSLEYQLCKHLKFDKSMPVDELIQKWDQIFHDDALSLVAATHRPLIACWLKWVLLIHDLRETLASYTCVGVIGLVNSGKSQLVKTLFRAQAMVGTIKAKRTTVPFLYNYDGQVDGFDVIDFPGVDDKDTVPELAKLLVGLAQAVIFVVDYRKINTETAQEWLKCLTKESGHIPVLVCLTFADRLLIECRDKACNSVEICNKEIMKEFENIKDNLGFSVERYPKISMKLCCFNIASDSSLQPKDLKAAGISQAKDVGDWLVELFKNNDQKELGENLAKFIEE